MRIQETRGRKHRTAFLIRRLKVQVLPGVPPLIASPRSRGGGHSRQRLERFLEVRKGHLVFDDHFRNEVVEELAPLEVVRLRHVEIVRALPEIKDARRRTAERLLWLISVYCVLSWRIFWMTMVNRSASSAPASAVLTKVERRLLDHSVPDREQDRAKRKSLPSYITKVARLGGYLARANDPPPGNIVMWRGLSRFTDIELGFSMAQDVGN